MSQSSEAIRRGLEWLAALTMTAFCGFLFLNGSFFSSYDAIHVDLSINLTAAHSLRDGDNPYGPTTLLTRAEELGSPTHWIYDQLYTSYIQPPTSALSLLPLTALPWRDATHLYLVLNHVLLLAAVVVTLITIRPSWPLHWTIAGVSVLLAAYACIPFSFSLGQVDGTVVLLLAIGYWAYSRDKPAVAGAAIAIAAAIKIIPGLLLVYFLWKREYRIVLWVAGIGLALLLVSLAFVGLDVYRTYITETLPALTKGSSHYSNTALNAVISRSVTPDVINGMPEMYYLDEVPAGRFERFAFLAIEFAGLLALSAVIPRRSAHPKAIEEPALSPSNGRSLQGFFEYYFVIAIGLLISSSTWDFYVIWLLPVFLVAFLAPDRVLPAGPARWLILGLLAVALIGLNFPGDLYLFERNGFFYQPDLVPGKWVEDRVLLYHNHLDAVILLRLPSLLLLTGTLAGLVLWQRRSLTSMAEPAPEESVVA